MVPRQEDPDWRSNRDLDLPWRKRWNPVWLPILSAWKKCNWLLRIAFEECFDQEESWYDHSRYPIGPGNNPSCRVILSRDDSQSARDMTFSGPEGIGMPDIRYGEQEHTYMRNIRKEEIQSRQQNQKQQQLRQSPCQNSWNCTSLETRRLISNPIWRAYFATETIPCSKTSWAKHTIQFARKSSRFHRMFVMSFPDSLAWTICFRGTHMEKYAYH